MINDFVIRTVISSLLGHRHVPEKMIEKHRRFGSIQGLRTHIMRQPSFLPAFAHLQDTALQEDIDPERTVTVFQHIPKCGGTSLHHTLEAELGKAFPERHNGLGNWTAGTLAKASFFSGHFDTPSLALLPRGKLRVVTMLRDPQARLLSLYRFLRAIRPEAGPKQNRNMGLIRHARTLDPEDFFAHPDLARHPSIHNAMVRQLAEPLKQKNWESFYPKGHAPGLTDTDPDTARERALAHLRGMAAVAVLEDLPGTLPPLMTALGLPPSTALPHDNTVESNLETSKFFEPVPEVTVTAALQKALTPHIENDRRLYDAVLKLVQVSA